MVALPPAGIAGGSVPTRANRAASAPVIVAPVIVTGAEPVLRTVTFCWALAAPPITSVKTRRGVASARPTEIPPWGLSSLMSVLAKLLGSSLTYRLPVVGSSTTSSGWAKPVKPVMPVVALERLPLARTSKVTSSWLAL